MKDYLSKKFQKAKLHFENFRSKAVVRFANMAKRLEPKTMKEEKKK